MVIRRTEKGFLPEQRLNTLKSPNSGKGKFEGKSVKSPCKHHGDEELGTTRSCLCYRKKVHNQAAKQKYIIFLHGN